MARTRQAPSRPKGGASDAATHGHGKHAKPGKRHKPLKHKAKHHKHKAKHHKRRHHRRHKVVHHPAGLPGAPLPTAPPSPPGEAPRAPLSLAQAQRLLWRAGFGPTLGETQGFVGQQIQQAVYGLTRPSGAAVLSGPAPSDDEGHPLAPADAWGHDHCWWLDRMIRSNQPLVERMTFIWHDWFANSNEKVNSQQMMLDQNELFRSMALGSFRDLFMAVTVNPAMLVFLDSIYNDKDNPNENYAREMMELFSLGADRGAYTEDDVREMARALTGWTAEWSGEEGLHNFRFDPSRHDDEPKTVFGQTGNWNWEDAVRLCVTHPMHPSFFVEKLWGYFIATPPDPATDASLQGLYVSTGYSIQAVLEAILQHPLFYEGPELVTPPVIYNAGLLRAAGRYIDTTAWAWLSAGAGQQLFYPPNVSGWDFTRWLDTSTAKARWELANYVIAKNYPNPWPPKGSPEYDPTEEASVAMASALGYWADPVLSPETANCIGSFAQDSLAGFTAKWEQSSSRAMRQNALRILIATSPDMQVS
jgi:hypothetical protein